MIPRLCIALFVVAPLASSQVQVYEYVGPAAGDRAGWDVAGAGDVDGDGWPDVAVGLPESDAAGLAAGRVDVLSGRDGSIVLSVYGSSPGDRFGSTVDGLGDLDGDGRGELIVGSPRADFPAFESGKVSILSGTGQVLLELSFGGIGDRCGTSVAGVGDVDGDGTGDFAFGAPDYDGLATGSGRFDVYSGATLQFMFSREGTTAYEWVGYSLDGGGDVDGDGRADVVVGTPGADNAFLFKNNVGRVEVWSYVPFQGALLFSRMGTTANDLLGLSVAGLGDVDGDGVPDVAAGTSVAAANGSYSGHAVVVSGAAPHATLWSQDGTILSQLGFSVAGLGDLDGDGLGELGLSTPGFDLPSSANCGLVQAISIAGGNVVHAWYGGTPNEQLGRSLDTAGDLNLDGVADVVMGSEFYSKTSPNQGHAVVVLGQALVPASYCTAKVNSAGCAPTIASSGAPSASIADAFHVTASQVLNDVPGILIWSLAPAALPFGGGTLCVAPPVHRTAGQVSGSAAGTACGGGFDFHASHAFLAANGLVPGTVFHAQYWSRDNGFAPPDNMSLTDGLQITVVP